MCMAVGFDDQFRFDSREKSGAFHQCVQLAVDLLSGVHEAIGRRESQRAKPVIRL